MMRTPMLSESHLKIVQTILSEVIPPSLSLQVLLFGSRATGRAKPASDIDLALVGAGEKPLPFSLLLALGTAFEDSALPLFVDIVDFSTTSQAFQEEIRRTALPLWERPLRTS